MAMNPEIKARWVAALRSGKYEQAVGALRDVTGFCCLGVLCDLHSTEKGDGWEDDYSYRYHGNACDLPTVVQSWAEIGSAEGGEVCIGGTTTWLASHNDGYKTPRRTFAEIADAIEAQL